jgi:hypothetical protein
MKRIAPSLREAGIGYGDERAPGGSRTRRKSLKKTPDKDRPGRPDRPVEEQGLGGYAGNTGKSEGDTRDGRDDGPHDPSERERFVL